MVKNCKIHFSTNPNATWIVFINGLFADLFSWDRAVEYFEGRYHILRFNSKGQGENVVLQNIFSLADQVSYLENLLDELSIDKATYIGISNGGRVALSFAEKFPERVEKIFVADSYSKLDQSLELKLKSWLEASKLGGVELRFKVSAPWIFGESFLNEKNNFLDDYFQLIKNKDRENSEYLILGALEDETISLDKVLVPVHFLVGKEDYLTPYEKHLQMHMQVQHSTLDVVNGGHASLLEYPENIPKYIIPRLNQECL